MSDYERNKGKLVPFNLTEEIAKSLVEAKQAELDDFFETYLEMVTDDYNWYDEDLVRINDSWYKVEWEIQRGDNEDPTYAEVSTNEDGTIDFHTYHYNGGAHWSEVVEWKLNEN